MKLSAFSEEEEVLFFPLSCFEVVSIENENFYEHDIKVIRLRYVNKYKDIIHTSLENITKDKKGEELEKFINDAINSKYSKEICKYLNYDFNKHFYDEIGTKNAFMKILPTAIYVCSTILSNMTEANIVLAIGVVSGPGIIIVSGLVGIGVGFIAGKIVNKIKEKEEKSNLLFYSVLFILNMFLKNIGNMLFQL